jgi:hypothetical protein
MLNGYSNFINAVKRQRNLGLKYILLEKLNPEGKGKNMFIIGFYFPSETLI